MKPTMVAGSCTPSSATAPWVYGLLFWLLSVLPACRGTGLTDLSGLAEKPPLPYSVLVSGGAFVVSRAKPDQPVLAQTYRMTSELPEAFALESIVEVLVRARVFVRTVQDPADAAERAWIAGYLDGAIAPPRRQQRMQEARNAGHDFLLVVERLQDGPVDKLGVNGQWPITAAVWLMLGLGLVIPDHSYESRADLRVSLHEVQTGTVVYDTVLSGGSVDLSLAERTDLLGLLTSILVPPFWVGDDDQRVAANVRDAATRRLLESLARQLKTVEVLARIDERVPARVRVERLEGVLVVSVEARESLSYVRMRIDDAPVMDSEFADFERRLLRSVRHQDGILFYQADYPLLPSGARLQVLVQTVAGRAASVTVARSEL